MPQANATFKISCFLSFVPKLNVIMFKSSLILLALSLSLVRCEIVTFRKYLIQSYNVLLIKKKQRSKLNNYVPTVYASGGTAPLIAPVLNTGTGTVQGYVPIESYAWGTSQSGTTHMGVSINLMLFCFCQFKVRRSQLIFFCFSFFPPTFFSSRLVVALEKRIFRTSL